MQSLSPNLPHDKQGGMLRKMLTIRRFEERASADHLVVLSHRSCCTDRRRLTARPTCLRTTLG
jgi:hypothetical protein